jgi:hypothetical protein
LFTGVRIAPSRRNQRQVMPERLFFHGANRSDAPVVPSIAVRVTSGDRSACCWPAIRR